MRSSLRPRIVAAHVTLAAVIMAAVMLAAVMLAAGPLSAGPASAAAVAAAVARAGPGGIAAPAADLADLTTGRRLWSRGLNKGRPIASITKVMTALVVIRAGGLERPIRITASEAAYPGRHDAGSAGLIAGDVLTARQLLEGMLLSSGADAAFALARAYGPGWPAFVTKMNATARALGMTHTHFANFDGLPWPTEYSTYASPRALLLLARAALRSATLRAIISQREHYIGATRAHHAYFWTSTDLLLGQYPGALGIKTGFTKGAGNCLLFAAERRGQLLAGVVLGTSPTDASVRFTAAARLLNWGFSRSG